MKNPWDCRCRCEPDYEMLGMFYAGLFHAMTRTALVFRRTNHHSFLGVKFTTESKANLIVPRSYNWETEKEQFFREGRALMEQGFSNPLFDKCLEKEKKATPAV